MWDETTRGEGTALVTGASSGIGYELAKQFAADGFDVLLVSRRREKLNEVADELAADYGVEGHVYPTDLSEPDRPPELYEQITEDGHEVDALVNNAGYGSWGRFFEDDMETDRDLIELHVATVTTLTKLFGRDMADRGSGYILNTASVVGWTPAPNSAVYSAAKHYERAFSEALAEELASEGITVTALCPGETETGFFERGDYEESGLADADKMTAAAVAKAGYEGLQNGERIVIPGRVNKVRVFLRRLLPRSLYVKIVERTMSK
jgi:short-subunit dehydrogenase